MPSEQLDIENGPIRTITDSHVTPGDHENQVPKIARGIDMEGPPVIDMEGVEGERRNVIVQEVREACETFGSFRVKNHDVPLSLMKRMQAVVGEFFELRYSEETKALSSKVELSGHLGADNAAKYTLTPYKSKGMEWCNRLHHRSLPASERNYELWPTDPPSYRETEEEYVEEQDKLTKQILELISESLGLSPSYLTDYIEEKYKQSLVVNYYPPCPDPEIKVGLAGHTDYSYITLLLQGGSPGLQVRLRDGEWVTLMPEEGVIDVFLGDQLTIMTHGKYKSIVHRALTNENTSRMSIVAFTIPCDDCIIQPLPELADATQDQIQYKKCTFAEFKVKRLAEITEGQYL